MNAHSRHLVTFTDITKKANAYSRHLAYPWQCRDYMNGNACIRFIFYCHLWLLNSGQCCQILFTSLVSLGPGQQGGRICPTSRACNYQCIPRGRVKVSTPMHQAITYLLCPLPGFLEPGDPDGHCSSGSLIGD